MIRCERLLDQVMRRKLPNERKPAMHCAQAHRAVTKTAPMPTANGKRCEDK